MSDQEYNWWDLEKVPEGEAHTVVFNYVQEVERQTAYLFDRFYKLNCLYDPYFEHISGYGSWHDQFGTDYNVSENVIASAVDTVTGIVASNDVRARFIPVDGDFRTQRQAKHLEWYIEGLDKRLQVHVACVEAFKNAALKGTGLIKVYANDGRLCVEQVPVDDIIVDEIECRHNEPTQMHQRIFFTAEELKKRFPGNDEEIDRAKGGGGSDAGRYWADYRPFQNDQVVAIESWYLGRRHTITIDGATLFDEEYDKDYFPFAVIRWSKRPSGWYGIGAAERIAGHQRVLNKTNWQIDRQLDQLAVPTTFVRLADAKIAVQSVSRAGTIVPYKGLDVPKTVIPQAVSKETYGRQAQVKQSALQEVGVSQMAATASKPAGLESGEAIRQYRDATTQRFSVQERGFEALKLRANWLMVAVCKELGDDAPEIVRKLYGGNRKLEWSDVDLGEVEFNMAAASKLGRTPAGKKQLVLELAQGGIISKDSAAKMMELEDIDGELSFYTVALKNIDMIIEYILDGGDDAVPEEGQNLELGVWRVQMATLKAQMEGAPEERLERLREWRNQAAFILADREAQAQPAIPPLDPMMDPAAAPMPAPAVPGMDQAPIAQLSPQAGMPVA